VLSELSDLKGQYMTAIQVLFYLFSTIAIFSALMVVASTNPVRGVLSLVLTFFAMAGIWLLLHAEFLALILVLVYVGAVMTLFLFVVMMLSVEKETRQSGFVRYLPVGFILVVLMTGLIISALMSQSTSNLVPSTASDSVNYSNLVQIGSILYTDYVYPFEIAGVLLLAAIIAAITLTHRAPHRRKVQNPAQQTAVTRENSVRLIKMGPEGKENA